VKRVLVTGASGFVGRQTLAPLAALGFEVHAAGRSPAPAAGVAWHEVDLLDPFAAERLCWDVAPSHLLHVAWFAEPGRYWTSPENPRWVEASVRLLRAFVAAGGRRAVGVGTCAEYDWSAPSPFDERTTPLRPASLYAACKHAVHVVQEAYAASSGVSQAWARLFHLYGPHEHPGRLVPGVAIALRRGGEAACTEGRHRRDFLHVADAGEALARLLDSGVAGAVNVASGEAVAVRAVVEEVARHSGGSGVVRFGARALPAGEPDEIAARVDRLRDEVGWRPRRTLAEGIADVVAWWREHEAEARA
jgi:nucleoside-diphosphate-sugar epimerase